MSGAADEQRGRSALRRMCVEIKQVHESMLPTTCTFYILRGAPPIGAYERAAPTYILTSDSAKLARMFGASLTDEMMVWLGPVTFEEFTRMFPRSGQ